MNALWYSCGSTELSFDMMDGVASENSLCSLRLDDCMLLVYEIPAAAA